MALTLVSLQNTRKLASDWGAGVEEVVLADVPRQVRSELTRIKTYWDTWSALKGTHSVAEIPGIYKEIPRFLPGLDVVDFLPIIDRHDPDLLPTLCVVLAHEYAHLYQQLEDVETREVYQTLACDLLADACDSLAVSDNEDETQRALRRRFEDDTNLRDRWASEVGADMRALDWCGSILGVGDRALGETRSLRGYVTMMLISSICSRYVAERRGADAAGISTHPPVAIRSTAVALYLAATRANPEYLYAIRNANVFLVDRLVSVPW